MDQMIGVFNADVALSLTGLKRCERHWRWEKKIRGRIEKKETRKIRETEGKRKEIVSFLYVSPSASHKV